MDKAFYILEKLAYEDYTKYKYKKDLFTPEQEKKIKKKFSEHAKRLKTEGVMIGNLPRVLIPKEELSKKEITKGLGFLPTRIAVPETGQTKFRTFRHPYNNYHIHSHKKYWAMHKDEYPSFTSMVWAKKMKKNKSLKKYESDLGKKINSKNKNPSGSVGSFIKGMPHNITEGVPGWASYLGYKYGPKKNRKTVVQRVKNELKIRQQNEFPALADIKISEVPSE